VPGKYLGKNDQDYKRVIITQRNGTIVTNDYDKSSRLVNRTIQKGEDVEGSTFENFAYDGLNRLNYAENDNFAVEFKFDPLNRITEEKQRGKLLNYTYSVVNNLRQITMKYPNDRLIEKNFDILDRLSNIKQADNEFANFKYIGRSYRLLSKQFGNGDAVSYLYDQGRRMTEKKAVNKNSDLINHYKYGYNKVHMKNYEQRMHENGIGDVFGYDAVYRLTNAKFNVPDPTVENPTDFERERNIFLDHVDNITRIDETKNGETTQITTEILPDTDNFKLNQYSRFDQWGLSYDKKGNTTQKGTLQLSYDYRNQLVTANDAPSNTQVEMKYDVLGRRIQKSVTIGGQTKIENYYHSGHQVIEVRDENDQLLRQYIYGNGIDEIIRMDKFEGGTFTSYYYHTDASGSVTAITDANGQLVERVTYDIYGMPTFFDADGNEIAKSSIGNNILFHGREYDDELNLYYFRARYYDPIMGRFLQTDPMGYTDSMNLYQGFNMNPMNFLDPLGTESQRSSFVRETIDRYNKLVKWRIITKAEASIQIALEIKAWDEEHSGTVEPIETESTFLRDFLGGCWNTIKGINNYLPGKAKEATHEAVDNHNANLQKEGEKILEEDTWLIQTEIDGKKTSPKARDALGEMAADATNEAQWSVATGIVSATRRKANEISEKVIDSTQRKKVTNPHGKRGGPLHQGKIREVAKELSKKGYVVDFEEYIKTPGGFKKARYADIIIEDPVTKKKWLIQVGKKTKKGLPISREMKAIKDLENEGWIVEFIEY
jgi:RHS repeat-associated protein